jgi:hypothetical protein
MHIHTNPEMRSSWPAWADFLRQRGLEGLVAWLLEAAGPLTILGAQALHFGEPFLRPAIPVNQLEELAHLLEETDEGQAFVSYLREKGTA